VSFVSVVSNRAPHHGHHRPPPRRSRSTAICRRKRRVTCSVSCEASGPRLLTLTGSGDAGIVDVVDPPSDDDAAARAIVDGGADRKPVSRGPPDAAGNALRDELGPAAALPMPGSAPLRHTISDEGEAGAAEAR